jgi:hypothetical protein
MVVVAVVPFHLMTLQYSSITPTITGGGGMGMFVFCRDLIKDILGRTHKPSLQYGDIIVKKSVMTHLFP